MARRHSNVQKPAGIIASGRLPLTSRARESQPPGRRGEHSRAEDIMPKDSASDAYARKPWLSLYAAGIAPTQAREHHDMLSLYRSAAAGKAATALIYFDGEITYGA